MTKTWTTKSGKTVTVEINIKSGTYMVGLTNLVVDGKEYASPHYCGDRVEFTDGYKGQKYSISIPAKIVAEIEAAKDESGKMTEIQIANGKAHDDYEANVRKIERTMSK